MNHHEIAQAEIVERYVRHQLSATERLAFQEHFFACDECFSQVQTTAHFIAGVREAARAGVLVDSETKATAAGWVFWFRPAFAAMAFASLVLAVALGWLLLSQIPRLRGDLTRERQAREQIERENQERLSQANDALKTERQQRDAERAKLQSQIDLLAQNKPAALPDSGRSQANSPLVILDTVRGSQAANHELMLSAGAAGATIWVEVEPGNRYSSYRLQIFNAAGQLVETITGAKPNAYGAVAVTVPARLLRPGKYVVKLSGVQGRQHERVGEYPLNVRAGK
jgi:cell division protein FtsB